MKIAISNLAWNLNEDDEVVAVLKKHEITGIEVAPTKIWKNPTAESKSVIKSYRKYWNDRKINIIAAQSLLFGHPELKVFESKENRIETVKYLEKIIRICSLLGANALVFGSPSNRRKNGLDEKYVIEIAQEFFFEIGKISKNYNVFFCIEPNPKEYGTDFINTTEEAIELVKEVNHPNFRLHLDSGAMYMANEEFDVSIKNGVGFMEHFHISEKDLAPIGTTDLDHSKVSKALKEVKYEHWNSIEMLGNKKGKNAMIIDGVFKKVMEFYI